MFRFFADEKDIFENKVEIRGSDFKHLKTILRAKTGDSITVVTDSGEYSAYINSFEKDYILCEIETVTGENNETTINVVLFQGLPKKAKMEAIIQQNTELGVKAFIPLLTSRTIVKISEKDKEEKKLDRWRKIAKESAKQSRRNIIPEVKSILTIDELLKLYDKDYEIIVPYELEESVPINDVLKDSKKNYLIIIGPEGGFEKNEINKLKAAGARTVTLGKRILRTETAGIAAVASVMFATGEFSK